MLKRCKNLEWMVERHLVPIEGGGVDRRLQQDNGQGCERHHHGADGPQQSEICY